MIEKWIDRLPDHYRKDAQGNVYKFLKIFADKAQEAEDALQTIQDWFDIDQAQGLTLDRIGKDVGQPRFGLNDEDYRKKIKIKIRSNLSGGEIDTLNEISTVLMGENRFDGIQEGWSLPADFPIGPEPAMLLFTAIVNGSNYGMPMAEMDSVSAGGIKTNWQLLIDAKERIKPTYSTSNEQWKVHTTKPAIDPDYKTYQQKYLMAGMVAAGEGAFL